MKLIIPLCVACLSIPIATHAAVVINEVAWMGTTASANDEWIELYNSGSTAVAVDEWVLSDGQDLIIPLSGTIPAGAYAVLERTDDSSVPGTAFVIYTGALSNDGRTLTLRDAGGTIVDQTAGGKNWENIGGDNTTKETAQLTAGGWITAPATPGAKNAQAEAIDDHETDTASDAVVRESSSHSTDPVQISLTLPDTELQLAITGPTTGSVNQPLRFTAEASGLGDRLLDSLSYVWNLGNLHTELGKDIVVQYPDPGTYVLTLYASYARHEALARHTVTIVPAQLSLSINQAGNVVVHNAAPYEVDVSGYRLSGGVAVTFPEYSILAPRASVVVPAKEVSYSGDMMLALYDPAGELATTLMPNALQAEPPPVKALAVAPAATPAPAPLLSIATPVAAAEPPVIDQSQNEVVPPIAQISATSTERQQYEEQMQRTAAQMAQIPKTGVPPDKLPYLGLMGIVSLGIMAVYASKRE